MNVFNVCVELVEVGEGGLSGGAGERPGPDVGERGEEPGLGRSARQPEGGRQQRVRPVAGRLPSPAQLPQHGAAVGRRARHHQARTPDLVEYILLR